MRNRQNDILFDSLISGLDKSLQATIKMMYTHSQMINDLNHKREMEQMKKEIADDVLSRISATVDVSEIIEQIEELRRAIDSLGRQVNADYYFPQSENDKDTQGVRENGFPRYQERKLAGRKPRPRCTRFNALFISCV